jgi:ABC-type enterobactin transport system permease subunit
MKYKMAIALISLVASAIAQALRQERAVNLALVSLAGSHIVTAY